MIRYDLYLFDLTCIIFPHIQAILCESGCNFWFHRVCTGLAEAAFHFLTQEIYAEWVCDNCFTSKNVPLVKFKS